MEQELQSPSWMSASWRRSPVRFPLPDPIFQGIWTYQTPFASSIYAQGERAAAIQRRVHEFEAGRCLSASVLLAAGASTTFVGVNANGAPRWPEGFIGSIAHTRRFIGVAVAPVRQIRSLGIDIEHIFDASQVADVSKLCLTESERRMLRRAPISACRFATLCFSAKESIYKCLWPMYGASIEFNEVELVQFDERTGDLKFAILSDFDVGLRKSDQIEVTSRFWGECVLTATSIA